MHFEDKTLSCRNCHQPFTFTAGEQEFFAQKSLVNEPKRCPDCRILLRMQKEGKGVEHGASVPCAECGKETKVPFKPTGVRPVYCHKCFFLKKQELQKEGTPVESLSVVESISELEPQSDE